MAPPTPQRDRLRVLIIEDSDDHAYLTRIALGDDNFDTQRARTLLEAEQLIGSCAFDVALLDLFLPDSRGLDTLSAFRLKAPGIATIVLTSEDSDSIGRDALERGAQDFFPKRLSSGPHLSRCISHAVQRQQALNANAALTEALDTKNQALERAREAADEANRAKSEFLANMSHEIRTPLTALLGFAEMLESNDAVCSNPSAIDAVGTIRRNGEHLLSLINDILDASKIEAGAMSIEHIPVDLSVVAGDLIAAMRPQAEANGLSLTLDLDTSQAPLISCDPVRLQQILLNLVGNAIKFTQHGGVTVNVQSVPSEHRWSHVTCTIEDTGIGMSPEQLEQVRACEAFVQADSTVSRRFGGTGLGLRITHALVTMLGGHLQIDSHLNQGTRCTLVLNLPMAHPAARQGEASPLPAVSDQAASLLGGMRVLIVDDSPDNRRLFAMQLRAAGATVETAADGQVAIQMATDSSASPYDLVLMDVQMPTLDGLSATRVLRERGVMSPVFALTANTGHRSTAEWQQAGCDRFLLKPIPRDELLEAVASLLPSRPNAA